MAWLVSDARVLASAEVAADGSARRRGLLGRDRFDGALAIDHCRWVHTIGMRFPIDVAYVDREGIVVKTTQMKRHRIGLPARGAHMVIEAEAGAFARWELHVGDEVELRFDETDAPLPEAPGTPESDTPRPGTPRPGTPRHTRIRCGLTHGPHRSAEGADAVSTLWLVATPIGNMGDLAPRAVDTFGAVALVCCEDTRRTGLLLQRAGVRAQRLAVCNEHTEARCADDVIAVLDGGHDVALVSDAGSPGISDPGERLVRAVLDRGHAVSAVPGPTAAIMALTTSGLPTGRFVFEGFLPRKGRERAERLAEIGAERRTTVIYEAPPRVRRTLDDLRSACGDDRMVVVTRELTKLHEETVRGSLGEIDVGEPRGEYVLVVEGAPEPPPTTDAEVVAALRDEFAQGASTRDAAAAVSQRTGRRKREVYELARSTNQDAAARADQEDGGSGR